jgi:hypothetical protein
MWESSRATAYCSPILTVWLSESLSVWQSDSLTVWQSDSLTVWQSARQPVHSSSSALSQYAIIVGLDPKVTLKTAQGLFDGSGTFPSTLNSYFMYYPCFIKPRYPVLGHGTADSVWLRVSKWFQVFGLTFDYPTFSGEQKIKVTKASKLLIALHQMFRLFSLTATTFEH